MVTQTEEQHGQRVPLRFVEYRQEFAPAHDHQGGSVAHDTHEADKGRHHAPEDHHQHGEVLIHPLEQPVKRQHEEDQDHPAGQVAHDAETKEPLVSGDVVDRRGRVPGHEQLAGNVHETQGADDAEEQVPGSGHSPWIADRSHAPSSLNGPGVSISAEILLRLSESLTRRANAECLAPPPRRPLHTAPVARCVIEFCKHRALQDFGERR